MWFSSSARWRHHWDQEPACVEFSPCPLRTSAPSSRETAVELRQQQMPRCEETTGPALRPPWPLLPGDDIQASLEFRLQAQKSSRTRWVTPGAAAVTEDSLDSVLADRWGPGPGQGAPGKLMTILMTSSPEISQDSCLGERERDPQDEGPRTCSPSGDVPTPSLSGCVSQTLSVLTGLATREQWAAAACPGPAPAPAPKDPFSLSFR
ncbi:uncharacterized protein LOC119057308 [Artibeus jamaicensis]|uniref:uncharacterized protein LOC119057308 n=1 Tax=Artibeus jamaicensis TaxID=9417 RepID=UPI00235A55B2|nr:uncharacterized protein LOC119057308 [Artibeus jamaicensis]